MRVIKKDIDIFIDQLQKGDEGAFRVLSMSSIRLCVCLQNVSLESGNRRRTWFRRLF